jgi:hypothetical protein
MLQAGTPRAEVVFKMQSAGLDARLLDTPNAPAPAAAAAAAAPGAPMLELMDAPSTTLKCKDDPAFKKYFHMLNVCTRWVVALALVVAYDDGDVGDDGHDDDAHDDNDE